MKTMFNIVVLCVSLLLAASCSRNDDNDNAPSGFGDSVRSGAEIDAIADDVLNIIEEATSENSGRMAGTLNGFFPDCAVVTTTETGDTWQKTIDFGTSGCEMYNGNVLKGIIILNGTTDFTAMTQTVTYSFETFYHNDRKVEGNKYAVRILENENGNPESTIQLDLTITRLNGTVVTRDGYRVWEWVEGFDTPFIYQDNEYLVTGEWTTYAPEGNVTAEVTESLRVALSCPNITKGVLNFSNGSHTAELDYGTGNCDAQATLSIDGNSPTTIILN